MKAALEIKGLHKRFPGVWALRGIDITLDAGRVMGLVGPNGSGKTTLLSILMGHKKPTKGEVRIFGMKPGKRVREITSYVPEIDHLYGWMTVKEMADFTAGFYRSWNPSKFRELLEFMDLNPSFKIGNLSRGMRARLKLSLALAADPKLLLLDEPLSGIDPLSRDKILEAFIKWFQFGEQTVIFSTHIVREAEKLFDYVVFLGDGEIILQGEPDELRNRYGRSIEDIMKEVYR
ncbi:MAG TPA: ABC transporter ATP-binding protein [candidate division WOR-3 bacterium]|uniref:ABC transporter ATP-binding protein n=1 Tax=candidate division WOR-3 bacterium TaxID=2052148 RepID=A0A7C0XBR4_UNCW3|nr:ABC transporter ATP-binding protein [candidate division WOR-3 bacterium]